MTDELQGIDEEALAAQIAADQQAADDAYRAMCEERARRWAQLPTPEMVRGEVQP